jgi:hypothetical protein
MPDDKLTPGEARGKPPRGNAPLIGEDEACLVMFASPCTPPEDGLEEMLTQVRSHNQLVSEIALTLILDEDGSPAGEVVNYTQSGVVMAFRINAAEKALLCSALVLRRLPHQTEPRGDRSPASRIGISAGRLTRDRYVADGPCQCSGIAIEIAMRLVHDVAKPGDILLDLYAQRAIYPQLATVKEVINDVQLYPLEGGLLKIDGVKQPIPVFELVWNEAPHIGMLGQLAHELFTLKSLTLELRVKLAEARPKLSRPDVDDGTIRRFSYLLLELDPKLPKQEYEKLENQWKESAEAHKLPSLGSSKAAILPAYTHLAKTWTDQRGGLRIGGRVAGILCMEAWDLFCTAMERFSDEITCCLREIESTL